MIAKLANARFAHYPPHPTMRRSCRLERTLSDLITKPATSNLQRATGESATNVVSVQGRLQRRLGPALDCLRSGPARLTGCSQPRSGMPQVATNWSLAAHWTDGQVVEVPGDTDEP